VRMVFEAYTQQALSINAMRVCERAPDSDAKRGHAMGAIDSMGCCAIRLIAEGLLRKDGVASAAAHYPSARQRNGVPSRDSANMSGQGRSGSKCRFRHW